jgi:ribonuclease HI
MFRLPRLDLTGLVPRPDLTLCGLPAEEAEKLAAVARHLKDIRGPLHVQGLARRPDLLHKGLLPSGSPPGAVPGMSQERLMFEARQASRQAFHDREVSTTLNNKLPFVGGSKNEEALAKIRAKWGDVSGPARKIGSKIFGRAQSALDTSKIKRLEGATAKEASRSIHVDGSYKGGVGGMARTTDGVSAASSNFATIGSDQAERMAVSAAIDATPNNFRGNLYTDSANALFDNDLRWGAWQKGIGLRRTPAHSGNPGNEMANTAAKAARKNFGK